MIADLKPYPAMKDSGVPWLGEVPEHWEIRRIKMLFREQDERNGIGSGDLLSLTRAKGIVPQTEASNRIASAEDLSKYKICRPGDLVMNRMQAWSGMFALSTYEGVISPDYSIFCAIDRSDLKFFEHLFKTPIVVDQFAQRSKGIGSGFNRLYTPDFGAVPVVVPPLPEQAAIVRFLDHADRRIRRYISAKQKLIKLLEEQKQAIIHRAVTRGLDPNVCLKSSGVEWLGDVPEHWQVLPLKRIGWFKSGAGFPVSDQGDQNCEVPFLKVSDMTKTGNEVWIESENSTVSKETAARLGAFIFPTGTIIFPKVGGALLTNKRRLLRKVSCIDNNVMGCVIIGADLQYAFMLLQQLDIGRLSKPGPVPAIGEGDVREIKVSLPPLTEQTTLVQSIHGATATLNTAITHASREISLLREYRTRLIADVVTGKLDVRVAVTILPEETDEPEVLDDIDTLAEEEERTKDESLPEEAEL